MTRLPMKDHAAARRSLARVIRMRFAGEIDTKRYRDLVYGLSTLLSYFRLDIDCEYERRLEAIETALEEGKR